MILDEIRVNNWRNYNGEHTFKFEEGVNLIAGPNGSGKTTLFEVLWRTFFDRSNTNSAEMQEIRPAGTTLSPRASILFSQGGKRYKIEKQFLDHQYARLYEWHEGGFSLIHEQDMADSALSELLSGTLTGRGSTEPKNRGIAEALWYLQKDVSLPYGGWNEGLKRGLGGIIDIAIESSEERRILKSIDRDYSENLTESKGEPRKNTELYRVYEDLRSKNLNLADLRSKLQSADVFREQLEQLISEETEKDKAMTAAKSDKEKSEKEIKEAESFERKKLQKEADSRVAALKVKELKEKFKQIQDRTRETDELRKKVDEWNLQFLDSRAKSNIAKSEREKFESKWREELQPKLNKTESDLEALETYDRINNLKKEKVALETFLAKFKSKEGELMTKKRALEDFIAPSKSEVDDFRRFSTELVRVESKLSVNSIRVGFQLKKGMTVVSDQETSKDNGDFIVTGPTTFTLKNAGKVKIRGGGESLRELNESRNKLLKSRSELLKKYSVNDDASLNSLLTQRGSLDQDIKSIKKEVTNLAKEQPNAENDLAKINRDIKTTERKMKGLQMPSIDAGDLTDQIEELKKAKKYFNREIDDCQSKEKDASESYDNEYQQSLEFKSKIDGANARMSALEGENTKAISPFGSLQGLENTLQEATKIQDGIEEELASMNNEFDEKVTAPKRRAEMISSTMEKINVRLIQIGKEIAGLQKLIEQVSVEGLYTKVSDIEIEVGRLELRKAVLEKRANARRLLRELITLFKTQRTLAISAPIRKFVDPWLRQLTGGSFDSISINEFLQPDSAMLSDKVNKISLASLSYGTVEQVVILIRLAIATILSQKERNLVVLDDKMVNADPVRLQRMISIIDEVSKNCQIVISSCEDTRYLGLATNVIRLPDYRTDG